MKISFGWRVIWDRSLICMRFGSECRTPLLCFHYSHTEPSASKRFQYLHFDLREPHRYLSMLRFMFVCLEPFDESTWSMWTRATPESSSHNSCRKMYNNVSHCRIWRIECGARVRIRKLTWKVSEGEREECQRKKRRLTCCALFSLCTIAAPQHIDLNW